MILIKPYWLNNVLTGGGVTAGVVALNIHNISY